MDELVSNGSGSLGTGAVLLEVHDEWAIAERRYFAEGSMALLDRVADDGTTKEVDGAKSLLLAS